jgi:S-layer protein (TIGR01564 family)
VANVIVQELVDLGFTTYEEWDTSPGEYQVFEDVYALGKDVLVVAGMDRTATAKAALDLIAEM